VILGSYAVDPRAYERAGTKVEGFDRVDLSEFESFGECCDIADLELRALPDYGGPGLTIIGWEDRTKALMPLLDGSDRAA
jgi:hypothetical protein